MKVTYMWRPEIAARRQLWIRYLRGRPRHPHGTPPADCRTNYTQSVPAGSPHLNGCTRQDLDQWANDPWRPSPGTNHPSWNKLPWSGAPDPN